jgi:hypothetical protein
MLQITVWEPLTQELETKYTPLWLRSKPEYLCEKSNWLELDSKGFIPRMGNDVSALHHYVRTEFEGQPIGIWGFLSEEWIWWVTSIEWRDLEACSLTSLPLYTCIACLGRVATLTGLSQYTHAHEYTFNESKI